MIEFIRRLRVSLQLDKAYQLTSKGCHEEALKHMEAAEALGLPKYKGRWTKTAACALLLKALLKIETNQFDDALRTLIEVQQFLLNLEQQSPEVIYLECVASVLAGDPLRTLRSTDLARRGFQIFKTPYEAVKLNLVPNHIKRKFPLKGHPEWSWNV